MGDDGPTFGGDERDFVLDTTHFPVVRMIFPRIGNHESIDKNMVNMLALCATERIAVIGDSRQLDVKTVTPTIRKHFFDKVNEFSALRGHHMLGEAALVGNWVHKHFYQAYLWMKTDRPYPTKAFDDEELALAWCRSLVADAHAEQAG
ncbi:MAG: hypothetical protein AAF500_17520 [Myxococcota bacterium]